MSGRPELTPAQLVGVQFALAEVDRLYRANLSYTAIASGIMELLDGHALPVPAALGPGWIFDLAAISAGEDELRALLARAVIVQPEFSPLEQRPAGAASRAAPAALKAVSISQPQLQQR